MQLQMIAVDSIGEFGRIAEDDGGVPVDSEKNEAHHIAGSAASWPDRHVSLPYYAIISMRKESFP
jgi:hypothetical protein